MELGLQIARLNGDVKRVAEFESALDEFRHPERSTSTDQPDPDQARRVGSTKDGREGSPR
jgi:hypothetical protein